MQHKWIRPDHRWCFVVGGEVLASITICTYGGDHDKDHFKWGKREFISLKAAKSAVEKESSGIGACPRCKLAQGDCDK